MVVLEEGSFADATLIASTEEALAAVVDASVVAIDIPIGIPAVGPRDADVEARQFVGPIRSSVFATPPRPLLEQSTYAEALREAERLGIPGLSKQSWGLRERILDVERLLRSHHDIVEAHPEVCFAAMNGGPLGHGKRTWNGCRARVRLLAEEGIELPELLPGIGRAPVDDVLDAAAAAWTANRKARGLARTLPADPPLADGRPVAIWY